MRIYIVDCDRNVRSKLKCIIEDKKLGDVDGMSSRWEEAYQDIQKQHPDIILAELAPPVLKSMIYLQKVKEILPGTAVVLLSQIHDEETVRQVYEKGAEFLIHKPLYEVEIKNILHNLEMTRTVEWLISRAGNGIPPMQSYVEEKKSDDETRRKQEIEISLRRLKEILHEIGIYSEAGSKDIISVIRYLIEQNMDHTDVTICELCCKMNQNPKSVEQRIRRAAASGMANLASRGMEDYADPVFNEYAGRLYSFEQIKKEMNYIRGKSERHGNVRIRNFLSGLLDCCREL